ncbi:MAG: RecB family exonuclease [Minisyncoccota bacterium]
MKTSYSALETYKICPQKYKFQIIDRIKTPKRMEAVFGTLIHSALNYMFERNPLYPTLDEVINYYTNQFKETAERVVWTSPDRKEAEEKMYFEEGIKLLKNFYKKNQPWTFNVLELEGRFSLELTDDLSGKVHTLSGIIDRIDKDAESEIYEIIDYKTGKKMPAQKDLENNLQLGLYHLAIINRWPHLKPDQVKVSLYFLRHNDKVSATPTDETVDRLKKTVLATIREIETATQTGVFPPLPSGLCNFCGYRKICPMWSHEYKRKEVPAPNEVEVGFAIKEFFDLKATSDAQKKRSAELREVILRYMEQEQIERVFGDPGYITKSTIERTAFDIENAEMMLKSLGVWEKILEPDTKRLEKLFPSLPDAIQEELAAYRTKKQTIILKQTKKKSS